MTEPIRAELVRLAADEGIRILYACESGSRAWGFASPDSDWDVRFLYVRPLDWYLSIREGRDVIEAMLPNDLDLAGWDLRKALGLLAKSNPSLIEWLQSPIVYTQDDAFMAGFRRLAAQYASRERSVRHYLHMAQGNWRSYLQADEVPRKKYLYVLRPVYACRWIERDLGPTPMEFDRLRAGVPASPEIERAIDRLLIEKRSGSELGLGPQMPELHAFLGAELERIACNVPSDEAVLDEEPLNAFFRKTLGR
jgi:predicted nucleotidyltransferase